MNLKTNIGKAPGIKGLEYREGISMVGGGLAYFDEEEEHFFSFTEEDGLPNNIVSGVVEDDNGSIWCATEGGIAILQDNSDEIFYLTPDDGIGGWEFSSGGIKSQDGSLYFGGENGLIHIPSHFITTSMPEPLVYITDVYLFQEPVGEYRQFYNDAELSFGPNDSYLEFRVVALDFDTPTETRFKYKLEGFDEDWISAGTRDYIAYSSLPAGDYELKVISESARNVLSQQASLKFTISRAWYRTPVAYGFYVIMIILLFIGFWKIHEGRMLEITNSELGITNKKLEDANTKLEQLSTQDALTGIYNRRYFDVMFDNHLKLAIRSHVYLALILIDIDDFKLINDQYGHIAGDQLLYDMAKEIDSDINRATDFIARYGGDEFVVVLYDTERVDTIHFVKRIMADVRKVRVRDDFSKEAHSVTVSVGVICEIPDIDMTPENYIIAADKALYQSKEKGKNCMTIAE